MPISLLSWLKRDETDLFNDLMAAPARTLKALMARVAELDAASVNDDAVAIDDWPTADETMDGEDLPDVLAERERMLAQARKEARQRLRVAQLLVATRTDLD